MDEETNDYIKELNEKYKKMYDRSLKGAMKYYKEFVKYIDEDTDTDGKGYALRTTLLKHGNRNLTKEVLRQIAWDLTTLIQVLYSHYKIEVETSDRSQDFKDDALRRINNTIKIYLHLK